MAAIIGKPREYKDKILVGTSFVLKNEPCLGLYEMTLQSPGSRGPHRYQILHVNRGDKVAEFQLDMGPQANWTGTDQIRIPGGAADPDNGRFLVEHTVGELRDIAEWFRWHKMFDKREIVQSNAVKVK